MIKGILSGAYDAVYFGTEQSSTDPANNLDFWISSGGFHVWHSVRRRGDRVGGPDDDLMRQQMATTNLAERRGCSLKRSVLAENIPVIYVAAPRITVAKSPRLLNTMPVPLRPPVLWNADILAVRRGGASWPRGAHADRRIFRRLGFATLLVLLVSSSALVLARLAPGDTTDAFDARTPEQIAEDRRRLGLDLPLHEVYGQWLARLVRLDLGTSLKLTSGP